MACNCKSEIEAKFLARAKEVFPQSTDHSVELTGYTFLFGEGYSLSLNGCMPAEIQHKVVVKKTGLSRIKKEKQSFIFTYCPFCGVPYKKENGEAL